MASGVTVILEKYPINIRQNKVFLSNGETSSLSLSVTTNVENEMGNLSISLNGGEDDYTFVKLDKSKNKNYIKK